MWWLSLIVYLFMTPIHFFPSFSSTVPCDSLVSSGEQTKILRRNLLPVVGVPLFLSVPFFLSHTFFRILSQKFQQTPSNQNGHYPLEFYFILITFYFLRLEGSRAHQRKSGSGSDRNGLRVVLYRNYGTIYPPSLCSSRKGDMMVPELQQWRQRRLPVASVRRIHAAQ